MTPKVDPRLAARKTPQTTAMRVEQRQEPQSEDERKALLDRIKQLEEMVEASKMGNLPRTPGLRIAPKGGVSMYGIHANFPITAYADQWPRIFEMKDEVLAFIEANKELLDFKDDTPEVLAEKQRKREEAGIVARVQPRMARIETATTLKKAA